jgi:hypothetical protein
MKKLQILFYFSGIISVSGLGSLIYASKYLGTIPEMIAKFIFCVWIISIFLFIFIPTYVRILRKGGWGAI